MVGGVTDDKASVSLTAFVTGALLEAHKAGLLPADAEGGLSAALQYLMDAAHDTNYAKVLVAHTLTMAAAQESQGLPVPPGLAAAAAAALDDMQAIAVTEGTMTHWAPKEQPSSDDDKAVGERCSSCYVAHAGGPEVEMTGYAMSTMITALGEDALADGFPVAKWLLSERSPTGGWRSTQVWLALPPPPPLFVLVFPPRICLRAKGGCGPLSDHRHSLTGVVWLPAGHDRCPRGSVCLWGAVKRKPARHDCHRALHSARLSKPPASQG